MDLDRAKTEERLLAGIRAKLAAPALIKHMTRAVQARLREQERPDCGGLKRELAEVERELQNVVTAIGKLGGSAALLSRVRELEARQAALESEISTAAKTPSIAPNVERIIRRRITELDQIPRDQLGDEETRETSRAAVRGLLRGDVPVIEEGEKVYVVAA